MLFIRKPTCYWFTADIPHHRCLRSIWALKPDTHNSLGERWPFWVLKKKRKEKKTAIVSHILHIHPFCNLLLLASVYLNISFKTDGILILAPSCGILSPIHFPIRQSPSTPPFFLPRHRSVLPPALPPISQLTQLSSRPLSFPMTHFAEVCHLATLEYLFFSNVYYAETKEHESI